MKSIFQDIRYGARVLIKRPGLTVVAVITFMLGVGATSIIFTMLNAVVLRPLPYPQADRLVQVWETNARQGQDQEPASAHNFADWAGLSDSFEQISAYRYAAFNLTDTDQPERITGANVSSTFFSTLGVQPSRGRNFQVEDDAPGKNKFAIISHGLWQRRFGSDPDLVGRTVTLNGEGHTVVGIMPVDFQFPDLAEIWTPLGIDFNRVERGSHFLGVIARLKNGSTLQAAQAEMDAIARHLEEQFPNTNTGRGVGLVGLHEQQVGNVKKGFFLLFGAVSLLLLIACVNVANLLLGRATARQKEMAIRAALGASRLRLVQQSLIEALLIAIVGSGFGLLLAFWGMQALVPLLGSEIPRTNEIALDGRVLVFTLAVSLLTGGLSGLVPALSNLNPDLNGTLKDSGRTNTGQKQGLRNALVVAEVAFALVLLIGAGLLINSFFRLQRVNPGFDREQVLTMQVSLPRSRYADGRLQLQFFQQVLQQIEAIQGIQSAGLVSDLPFSGSRTRGSFEIEGRPPANPGEVLNADLRVVSRNYFKAMGISLLEGNNFSDSDHEKAPGVAVINQAMAKRYWPDESAIGKRLVVGSPEERALYGGPIWRVIVGVVGDIKHDKLTAQTSPEIYVPYLQSPSPRMAVAVRTVGNPKDLTATIRSAVLSVDSGQPVYNVNTMEERVSRSLSTERMNTFLLAAFATIALVLAAIGVYGIISYSVTQRTSEIGIRMALGAQRYDVLKLVVGQGMLLALLGVCLGAGVALVLARFISSFMFGISATDPITFIGVSILLLGIALTACYIPARRATSIDPMIALRHG